MSTEVEPDVYVTMTPYGRVLALFDDGTGVRLEGSDDAVAAVRRAIEAATNAIGMSLTVDNVEPADYFNFCQPSGSGILILEPADVVMDGAVRALKPDDEPAEVLDAAAGPIMIRILSNGKPIGTLTPDEFTKAAGAPRSMFLPDVIKKWNDWKEKLGEPERAEWYLEKKEPKRGRRMRLDDAREILDGLSDLPALRAQLAAATSAREKLELAKAIRAAREEQPGLTPQEQSAIATTIWRQLGGNKFKVMTGAKDPVALGEASGAPLGGLRFSLPTGFSQKDGKSTGINRVTIRLNASDTYDIEFGGARGRTYNVRATAEDIHVDNLREVFTRYTGLDTSMGSGNPFERTVSRKEARDAYDELSYAITDLQGHTDMELARAGSTDRIERAVETARRLEAGWPKDELQPRGIIERAEGLIDRANDLRREGGITEISQGDVKSFYLQGSTLTEAQKAAILAKPSRVTRSGNIDVPRFNKAEVERMVAEFEAANAAAAGGISSAQRAKVEGAIRNTQELLDAQLAYSEDLRKPMQIQHYTEHLAYLRAVLEGKAKIGEGPKVTDAMRVDWDTTQAVLDERARQAAAAPAGARFRYALVNRPADFATLPKGLRYEVEPRPAPGQPHYAMARHGILVTERELTVDELRAFELAPLVDGPDLDVLAARIAESMAEYAAAYLAQAKEEPQSFQNRILDIANSPDSGVRYSIGTPEALIDRVEVLLQDMVNAAPAPQPPADPDLPPPRPLGTDTPMPGPDASNRAMYVALLEQIAAGTHPQMLDPELADQIEDALRRFPDDAEVQALGDRAVVAYSNGLMAATG